MEGEALEQWGDDVARIEPLAGGVANDVWGVRVNGHLAVGRVGARSDAHLAWETELLQHLDREALTVPVPIPTMDGRLFADGVVMMTYVEGGRRDGGRLASRGMPQRADADPAKQRAIVRDAVRHINGEMAYGLGLTTAAMRRASSASSVRRWSAMAQPTTRREQTSSSMAR